MARQYVRPLPGNWWLTKRTYLVFMLRELTSLFVAAYALFLIVLIQRAGDPAGFSSFFEALQSPLSLVLHLITLVIVLFHTVTWINLTPKVLVLWWGDEQVSPTLITSLLYVGWLIASVAVAWLVLR